MLTIDRAYAVIQAENSKLICAKDRAQDIKALVAKLRESGDASDVL